MNIHRAKDSAGKPNRIVAVVSMSLAIALFGDITHAQSANQTKRNSISSRAVSLDPSHDSELKSLLAELSIPAATVRTDNSSGFNQAIGLGALKSALTERIQQELSAIYSLEMALELRARQETSRSTSSPTFAGGFPQSDLEEARQLAAQLRDVLEIKSQLLEASVARGLAESSPKPLEERQMQLSLLSKASTVGKQVQPALAGTQVAFRFPCGCRGEISMDRRGQLWQVHYHKTGRITRQPIPDVSGVIPVNFHRLAVLSDNATQIFVNWQQSRFLVVR